MLQAAIIGYGGMGKWHHEAISGQVKDIAVTGAYDLRPEANDEARAKGLKVYAAARDLFADQDIDVVIIATPNDSHKDYIIQGLEAGKHVVCEKPVVLSAADLLEIMEVGKTSPGLFTIHQNRRWDRDFQTVKTILEEGEVGKAYFIESRVNGSSVFLHGWRDYKINGGGMLYDWGVHLIDQALQLIPEKVTSVTAHLFNIHSQEVDDNVKVLLTFESGISMLLEVATNCFIPAPRWHVSGRDGTFVIYNWQCEGKIVKLADSSALKWENDIVYTAAGPTRTMAPRPVNTTVEKPLPQILDARGNEYHRWSSADIFYHNLVEAIRGEAALLVQPEEALRVLKVMELAFASAEQGHGVSCLI
ncbi:Gfo/Idh/MocA family protein [Candidatus Darwinibacter acetoxidans]|jgi:scyllo-inositol 2-dehydrogenase (NADP+)